MRAPGSRVPPLRTHLSCLASLGCAAEHGIRMSVLAQVEGAVVKAPGSAASSPTATDASAMSPATAAAADADPPISEVDLQQAWRLLDGAVALFLCVSIAHFACLRSVVTGMCAATGAVVAIWWWRRRQQRAREDAKALKTAMEGVAAALMMPTLILVCGKLIWLVVT